MPGDGGTSVVSVSHGVMLVWCCKAREDGRGEGGVEVMCLVAGESKSNALPKLIHQHIITSVITHPPITPRGMHDADHDDGRATAVAVVKTSTAPHSPPQARVHR